MRVVIPHIDLELTFSFVSLLLPSVLLSLPPISKSAVSASGIVVVAERRQAFSEQTTLKR